MRYLHHAHSLPFRLTRESFVALCWGGLGGKAWMPSFSELAELSLSSRGSLYTSSSSVRTQLFFCFGFEANASFLRLRPHRETHAISICLHLQARFARRV